MEGLVIVFLVLLKWEVAAILGNECGVQGWQGGKGRRVVRWEGGRFLILFKGGKHRVSPRFYLFVSDVNQGKDNLKKNFMAPYYGWGSTASRLEPLRGDSLFFTTKFPETPGTHFFDLGRRKIYKSEEFPPPSPFLNNPHPLVEPLPL